MAKKKSLIRCSWVDETKTDYIAYHDEEWGVPVYDDQLLFEFLVLESAQAGLSWYTILRKRENYRAAFADFDPVKVARFNKRSIARLLGDAGIVRNRLKIEATVNNARRFLEVQDAYGSFAEYMWGFVDGEPIINKWKTMTQVPATTPVSDQFSKDLKQRGFKFMGSTVVYAHMQAVGMVNDHTVDCFRWAEVQEKRR